MRVVFDTNIFVSAITLPGGSADRALKRVLESQDQLCVSRPILHELARVLADKFSYDVERISQVLVFLADIADVAVSRAHLRILTDEPDNRILECALAAKADVIVTGDKAMLYLRFFRGIRIMTLRDFLNASR